ncbi:hypothetical protein GMORB2_4774 [Geosmithia morbida]|uniref:Protein prenyltransferase n=1 Tax=Geosmithia morbida TaxID=1094350 RepID=A0A9P5CYI4_9HYPO|nr:uncharacterized protein GMORB2_4774 [Geosmithia morbida]KAF4119432.1 hypothetical protein GMORB2_4774 [Geosmithia morbida]
MSRALDKGIKEALGHGDHEKVFSEVASALAQRHEHLLEIELLGPSHVLPHDAVYLQDGNALALPKLRLVQAFIAARKKLGYGAPSSAPNLAESREVVMQATAVALLMDAENLTAANTRKRTLAAAAAAATPDMLQREKYFIDSLLTSRLHRHTKSPTLWSHRRWLLGQLGRAGLPVDAASDLRRVVFVSGERHPRNYYAWCHARHLVDVCWDGSADDMDGLVDDTRRWCLAHHDDVSGWMFLLSLLLGKDREEAKGKARAVFDDTIRLAEGFRWRNESVWYFLRNLAASEHVDDVLGFRRAMERVRGTGEEQRRGSRRQPTQTNMPDTA